MNSLSVKKPYEYPVNIIDRRYILCSSLLFFIPAIHSYSCKTPFLGFMSIITGIASINFWWFGIPNWRLTIDKTVAYSTTIIYILNGFLNVIRDDIKGNYIYPLFYIIICLFAWNSYNMSCQKWDIGCPYWVIFHMIFHFFLSLGKFIVIEVSSEKCSLI